MLLNYHSFKLFEEPMGKINGNVLLGTKVTRYCCALLLLEQTQCTQNTSRTNRTFTQVMHDLCQGFSTVFTYTSDINTSTASKSEDASVVYINY